MRPKCSFGKCNEICIMNIHAYKYWRIMLYIPNSRNPSSIACVVCTRFTIQQPNERVSGVCVCVTVSVWVLCELKSNEIYRDSGSNPDVGLNIKPRAYVLNTSRRHKNEIMHKRRYIKGSAKFFFNIVIFAIFYVDFCDARETITYWYFNSGT